MWQRYGILSPVRWLKLTVSDKCYACSSGSKWFPDKGMVFHRGTTARCAPCAQYNSHPKTAFVGCDHMEGCNALTEHPTLGNAHFNSCVTVVYADKYGRSWSNLAISLKQFHSCLRSVRVDTFVKQYSEIQDKRDRWRGDQLSREVCTGFVTRKF